MYSMRNKSTYFGVDGAKVGVLKEMDKMCLGSFLQRYNCRSLPAPNHVLQMSNGKTTHHRYSLFTKLI